MLIVENLPNHVKFNYAVHQCGLDRWDEIAIRNRGITATKATLLEVSWSAFARPHVLPVPQLEPGEAYPSGWRTVPLMDIATLGTLTERQRLIWDVSCDDITIHRSDVQVLAACEWTWSRGVEATLAAFVEPNCAAVREILTAARSGIAGGYQDTFQKGVEELSNGTPAFAWTLSAKEIYECIRRRYRWRYEYEPPSFEADSQKVRAADAVWKDLEGTCVDLALTFASCLERAYLQPLVIVLRQGHKQHALTGWWVRPPSRSVPVLRSKADLCALLPDALEVVECTGFADGKGNGKPIDKTDFDSAVAAARQTIEKCDLWFAVDVRAAREQLDITPLAALCGSGDPWNASLCTFFQTNALPVGSWPDKSGWFTERTAWILHNAIREAAASGTGALRTQHILLALLAHDGLAERAVRLLGHDPSWLRGRLIHSLRKSSSEKPSPVEPTQAVHRIMQNLWFDAHSNGVLATEAKLLNAAVRQADSETVRRLVRDLGTTHAALIEAVRAVTSTERPQTPEFSDGFPEAI